MCASASLGLFVHHRLPEKHRSPESREVVRQGVTLLITFTAIVLGFLTNSVKVGFDAAYRDRGDDAAQLTQLDRYLNDYGPETAAIRAQLRSYVAGVIASTWPDEPHPVGIAYPDPSKMRRTGARLPWLSCCTKSGLISWRYSQRMHCKRRWRAPAPSNIATRSRRVGR